MSGVSATPNLRSHVKDYSKGVVSVLLYIHT